MNKRITTIEELRGYMKQKGLVNLFYSRQSILPNSEALDVILLGLYLQHIGIIEEIMGGTYERDRFSTRSKEKVATVKGSGVLIVLIYQNGKVKPLLFTYEFTNPQKWDNKEIKIRDIECEKLDIRPYHPENLLTRVECKNRKVVDIWKEVREELNYLYPFSSFTDLSDVLSGKRAREYYQKEYPEFIENELEAVLIENFEGGAEELEQAYNGKYVFLATPKVRKFGNVFINYTALIVPSQGMKEIIEETLDKTIKSIPSNENDLIKIQRKLYEKFVEILFNNLI